MRNPITAHAESKKPSEATRFAESNIQCAIVSYLRWALPHGYLFHSVPNGGYSLPEATAKRLKREGLRPGVGDLAIIKAGGWIAYLEVKTEEGIQSDDQIIFADWCGHHNVEYAVVRSVDEAEATLRAWGVPLRGRAQ